LRGVLHGPLRGVLKIAVFAGFGAQSLNADDSESTSAAHSSRKTLQNVPLIVAAARALASACWTLLLLLDRLLIGTVTTLCFGRHVRQLGGLNRHRVANSPTLCRGRLLDRSAHSKPSPGQGSERTGQRRCSAPAMWPFPVHKRRLNGLRERNIDMGAYKSRAPLVVSRPTAPRPACSFLRHKACSRDFGSGAIEHEDGHWLNKSRAVGNRIYVLFVHGRAVNLAPLRSPWRILLMCHSPFANHGATSLCILGVNHLPARRAAQNGRDHVCGTARMKFKNPMEKTHGTERAVSRESVAAVPSARMGYQTHV
jgi:hypothetical protein